MDTTTTTKITLEVELPTVEYAEGILEIAEGYIDYWAESLRWDPSTQLITVREIDQYADETRAGTTTTRMISYDHLVKAMGRAASGELCNRTYTAYIRDAVAERDLVYVDAPAADIILQVALFNEVKYG